MIKQPAKVVAKTEQFYLLESLPKSACPQCEAGKGCGGGILAKAFSNKTYQLQINRADIKANTLLQIGQSVQIGIPSSLLVKASLIVYIIPLLLMVLGAVGFSILYGTEDIYTTSGALIGFVVGLLFARFFSTKLYQSGISSSILLEDEQENCWYQAS